jgi:protein KTI12
MPLVIISGIPSSGKSTTAKSIQEFLQAKGKSVQIISEDEVIKAQNADKNVVLNDSLKEKPLRSDLKGQTLRHLSKETVVILDGLNYIKGYRYELYCASKTVKTTQITVHCDVSSEDAWAWNCSRSDESNKWSKDTFDGLVMRYEAPNGNNRWDSPLFLSLKLAPLDMEAVEAALYSRKPPPPNQSTQCQPLSSTTFLHELDKCTSAIISAIMEAQKLGLADDVKVPGTEERVHATRSVTMAELARTKRQFITYAKTRAIDDVNKLATMFVQYLNTALFN